MKFDMLPAVNGKIIELNRAYRGYIPCDWTADVFERISASQMVREHNTKLLVLGSTSQPVINADVAKQVHSTNHVWRHFLWSGP